MSVTAVPIRPMRKGSVAKLLAGLAILALLAAGLAWFGTQRQVSSDPSRFLARNGERHTVRTTASGLQIETIREGAAGPSPGPNDAVLVEYEGRLLDGTVFDGSARHGVQPAPFPVSGIIPGWTEALQLMKKGGKYRIWLPPELGYGATGTPGGEIPPNATLDFDITLVDFATQAQLEAMRQMQSAPPPGSE